MTLKSLFIDVFYPEKQKSYSGQHVQIRYYQKCIEKQLYNLGYAYFKADWLKSSGCRIHNEQLNVVENRLSLNETSEAIKNILTGKGSVAGSLVSWKTVEHDNSPFSRVDLYFAVCAKDTISDYIFFNEELCPHDYIDLIPTGLLKKENSNHSTWGARRRSLICNLEYYYEIAIERSRSQMMSYISSRMIIVRMPAPFGFLKDSGKFLLKIEAVVTVGR